MKSFQFWQRWLFVFSLIITIFGLGVALFSRTPLFVVVDSLINPNFWKANPLPIGVYEFQGWIYGVLGATMAGWGVFLAFIARHPFQARERWAWNAILFGLSLWFVTDTSISLYFGVAANAIGNIGFFLLGILPLIFTRREFLSEAQS